MTSSSREDGSEPAPEDVASAARRLEGSLTPTLALRHDTLDARAGIAVWLKPECLQKAGAFKFRGAQNAVLSLDPAERARGVVTHSSGNHAGALALAAREAGVPAYVVMPKTAPAAKRARVEALGARLVLCEPTMAAREAAAEALVAETGATFVHPYDDPRVIAGQGTAAHELLTEHPEISTIAVPVSGGGLLSGTLLAAELHRRSVGPLRVIGVEPEGSDDARRSLREGVLLPPTEAETLADGLRASLSPRTFAIARRYGATIETVSEVEIEAAVYFALDVLELPVEPSGAVGLAVALRGGFSRGPVGLILTGGNLDRARFGRS